MREWYPPGKTIAEYQISSRLSANGMGEVYLTRHLPTQQDRALKVLPSLLVSTPKRQARFLKIYELIATLRHRQICLVHEAGMTEDGRPFIAMEYIKGQSLDWFGFGHQLSFFEIIEIARQIAEGLDAAHRQGVLHLSIKPSNIMLTPAMQVKILDFGQALAFPLSVGGGGEEGPAVSLGDARYLSPEQVMGDRPDQRSDLFSLGVVLYEMLAGHTPFVGSTVEEVLASVTVATPLRLTEFREELPEEVNQIVDRALAKSPESRYRTAAEMAQALLALKGNRRHWARLFGGSEVRSDFEDEGPRPRGDEVADLRGPLSIAAGLKVFLTDLRDVWRKRRPGRAGAGTDRIKLLRDRSFREEIWAVLAKHRPRLLVSLAFLAAFFVTLTIGLGYLSMISDRPAAPNITYTRLTRNGKLTDATLSPDGRTMVYVVDEGARQSIVQRGVNQSDDATLLSTIGKEIRGLTFSPDGKWIGYVKATPNQRLGSLYRLPLGGGVEDTLATDNVIGTLAFSPDGRRYAFTASSADLSRTTLYLADFNGGRQSLAQKQAPSFFMGGGVAWSPEGKSMAAVVKDPDSNLYLKVVVYSLETGQERAVSNGKWSVIDRVAWSSDAQKLLVVAAEPISRFSQIWEIDLSGEEARRVTGAPLEYSGLGLSRDGSLMVTVQSEALSNIWIAGREDLNHPQQLTRRSKLDGVNGLSWTPDRKIVYVAEINQQQRLWITDLQVDSYRILDAAVESAIENEYQPVVSPDGRYLVYVVGRGAGAYLWRSDPAKRNAKRISDEGLIFHPSFLADGNSLLYSVLRNGRRVVVKSSIEGGTPVTLVEKQAWRAVVSPRGDYFAANYFDETSAEWKIAVWPLAGGEPSFLFTAPGSFQRAIRWMPDGSALAYIVTAGGISNLWVQPLAGGSPYPITNFTQGRIFDFEWSRDGRQLAFAMGWVDSDAVLIENFR